MNSPQLLALIDMQDGFNTTQGTQDVVSSIESADLSGFDLVAATAFYNDPTSLFVKQLGWNDMMIKNEKTASIKQIQHAYDISLPKSTYSAAQQLIPLIEMQGDDCEVFLAGFDTDGCVLATALDLFDQGVETFVIEPWCSSSGGHDMHDAAIKILNRSIGKDHVLLTPPETVNVA